MTVAQYMRWIRCLEIISEASRRLPGERHNYEDVADDMVWRTVQDSLGHLLTVVDDELQRS